MLVQNRAAREQMLYIIVEFQKSQTTTKDYEEWLIIIFEGHTPTSSSSSIRLEGWHVQQGKGQSKNIHIHT